MGFDMAGYDTGNGAAKPTDRRRSKDRWKPPPPSALRAPRSNRGSPRCCSSNCPRPPSSTRRAALEVAEIVRTLDADDDVVLAAHAAAAARGRGHRSRDAAATRFGAEAVRLARALSQLGEFGLPPDWTPERGLEPAQAEALRKMLVAVIGDVRLVVVKLAEQLQSMRAAKTARAAPQAQTRRSRRAKSMRRSPTGWACGR